MDYDMEMYVKCLRIVDIIIDVGGYGTVSNYLASVMLENQEAFKQVLNATIHGETIKELIEKKGKGDLIC